MYGGGWGAVFVAVNGWLRGMMLRKGEGWRRLPGIVEELAPLIRWGFVYTTILESLVRNVRPLPPPPPFLLFSYSLTISLSACLQMLLYHQR